MPKGAVQAAWGLEKESSAVAILDRSGQVLFFKDGEVDGRRGELCSRHDF